MASKREGADPCLGYRSLKEKGILYGGAEAKQEAWDKFLYLQQYWPCDSSMIHQTRLCSDKTNEMDAQIKENSR